MRQWIDLVTESGSTPADEFLHIARAATLPAQFQVGRIDDTTVELISIYSSVRGLGHGTQTMRYLCDLADRLHVTIELFARSAVDYGWDEDEDFGDALDQSDLEQWYLGMGFEQIPNRGSYSSAEFDDALVRYPKSLTESAPDIRWAKPRDSDELYRTVWIDADKLYRGWERDPMFVGGRDHPNAIPGRIDRFDDWMMHDGKTTPVGMPDVSVNDGVVAFGNGRHRFTWMREKGVRVMPVRVPVEHADEIQARFGVNSSEAGTLHDLPRRKM